ILVSARHNHSPNLYQFFLYSYSYICTIHILSLSRPDNLPSPTKLHLAINEQNIYQSSHTIWKIVIYCYKHL
ncbi:MAG TPA: hypothetical protein VF540_00920, partial [Segetibacter sp.]